MIPRVAVLYSGRFYGNLTPGWMQNHYENLIIPNNASVFVVADLLNICDAYGLTVSAINMSSGTITANAQRAFLEDARSVFFGWPYVYVRLLERDPPSNILQRTIKTLETLKLNMTLKHFMRMGSLLRTWQRQFEHFAQADDLCRQFGPFDVIVRARADILLVNKSSISELPVSDDSMYALGYNSW
eukprot:CAMPEP_0119322174 /NCGR_PEP_ID=MMETSP1333-20130426/57467_1 /TAXON_ID=418940 /ORGANISM="Scyphosphaera apsteinii, Strain RCC1455" /LENGTH=185 /DNA_ID=CAMNT_0007329333 /DNA_START=115 /DNA_END=669 /DNA_ORIENTATION=+